MVAVTKFTSLKDLLEPKVRAGIDGFPFLSEGYEQVKSIRTMEQVWENI